MIICHCHRVSDREVREACASGAGRIRAVASCTRAGTQCGGCVNHLRELLATYAADMQSTQAELAVGAA